MGHALDSQKRWRLTRTEHAVRNLTITSRVLRGETLEGVKRDYGLSHEQCRQIVYRYCWQVNRVLYRQLISPAFSLTTLREHRAAFGVM